MKVKFYNMQFERAILLKLMKTMKRGNCLIKSMSVQPAHAEILGAQQLHMYIFENKCRFVGD